MTTQRRTIPVQTRILNEGEGLVEYIASDASLDSYQESILPGGWRFDRFAKNAPFVDSHNYGSIEHLLGRVESWRTEQGKLINVVRWALDVADSYLVRLGWKLTVGKYLRAVSVGFDPLRWISRGQDGWSEALARTGMSEEDAGRCQRIWVEQQQIELSACIIGANPSAVARAVAAGAVGGGDLEPLGFSPADVDFIVEAARVIAAKDGDPAMRALMRRELARMRPAGNFPKRGASDAEPTNPGTAASEPGGAAAPRHQAVDEEARNAAFLETFELLVRL